MSTKLKDIKLTAVALCRQGANPDAHIMLYKSLENKGGKIMTFEEFLKSLTTENQTLVKTAIEDAKKKAEEDAKQKATDEAEQKVKDMTTTCKSLKAKIAELEKSAQPTVTEEDLMKNVPESIKKAIEDMKKRTVAAETIAKTLKEESVKKEFIAKAAMYKHIPAKPEDLGDILKAVSSSNDKDLYNKLEGVLKAADALIEKGGIFEEFGSNAQTNTSKTALDELTKKADDIVSKSTHMTKEQAFAKAIQDNKDLYERYLNEISE